MADSIQFSESDKRHILEFAKQCSFATIVSSVQGIPSASRLPVMIEERGGVVIRGYMARDNPQWIQLDVGEPVLVIFEGAHSDMLPSHLTVGGEHDLHHIAVHMLGTPSLLRDEVAIIEVFQALATSNNTQGEYSNAVTCSKSLLESIVGFEMGVEKMELKAQLSQTSLSDGTEESERMYWHTINELIHRGR